MEYTTWEEIDRGAVDPERVPEPAWDSMEQCAEGYRRMEFAKQAQRCGRKPEIQPQKFIFGGWLRESVAESGVRPEPTPPVYREEPRRRPEPEPGLEVREAETVKELMGKLEERVMRELCWCMRHGIRPTERER